MKKPDRFERIADNRNGEHYSPEEVAHELRKEHAWFRKMVRGYLSSSIDTGYVVACNEILSALAQRRK